MRKNSINHFRRKKIRSVILIKFYIIFELNYILNIIYDMLTNMYNLYHLKSTSTENILYDLIRNHSFFYRGKGFSKFNPIFLMYFNYNI